MAAGDDKTTKRANELGPTGLAVAANVARLRAALGMSTYKLSDILASLGRPIAASAITRIEGGHRRVDTDDLMALAVALDVPPSALLLPPTAEGELALTASYSTAATQAWDWAEGKQPLHVPPGDDGEYWNAFEARAKPPGRRQYRMTMRAEATANTTFKAIPGNVSTVAADVLDRLAKHRRRRGLGDDQTDA
jgi:transcriptional regulator with XRE-family HTH domain